MTKFLGHPAGLDHADLFFGVECEGALTGNLTAFVRSPLSADQMRYLEANQSGLELVVKVVFLTETFTDWKWCMEFVVPFCHRHSLHLVVGRMPDQLSDYLASPVAEHSSVMVRFFAPEFMSMVELLHRTKLGSLDQVSFGQPYHMVTVKVGDLFLTEPADYLSDKE